MRQPNVYQLDHNLTKVDGVELAGHHLERLAPVFKRLAQVAPVRDGLVNSEIVQVKLGLLVRGKSDFDTVVNYRAGKFIKDVARVQTAALESEAASAPG